MRMILESNNKMPLMAYEKRTIRICFNEREVACGDGEEANMVYCYDCVRVPISGLCYEVMVSAIINSRYDADRMQAIINNRLLEDDSEEHLSEFREMQQWRKTAKAVAKELMTLIND